MAIGRAGPRETQEIAGVSFPVPRTEAVRDSAYARDRVLLGPWLAALPTGDAPTTGHRPLRHPRVLGADPATFVPPMVLTAFHIGPQTRLGPFLTRLAGVVAIPANGPPAILANMIVHPTSLEWQRVAAFSHSARTVRGGGFALVTADGMGGARVAARCLNREIALSAGPFALARLTGAPLRPLAARWVGSALHITAGEAIPPGDPADMASAVAGFLERLLREYPAELSPRLARVLGAQRTGPTRRDDD